MACSKFDLVSSSSDDSGIEDPYEIFPEEVWKIIFNTVKEPKSLLNCSRTCTAFEDLLKPTEIFWLFPEVFPFLFHYLDKADCLALRMVGRQWNKAVNNYLENHEFYRPFDEVTNDGRHSTLYFPLMNKGFGWTEFHNTKKILSFMEEFKTSVRNPFIGRAVWVQYQDDEENGGELQQQGDHNCIKFWPAFHQFLTIYGKYVWYFSLGTLGSKNTVGRFIRLLRHCLTLLPNLRSLHLFGWVSDDENRVEDKDQLLGLEDEEWDLHEDALMDYFERKPLPVSPHLETLEIEYMEDLPDIVYEHVTKLHDQQLKCLQLTRWNFLTLNTSLPCLKELHLKLTSVDRLEKFFMRLKSPIGKLNLDFDVDEHDVDIPRLFKCISDTLGSTLCVLQITVFPTPYDKTFHPFRGLTDKPRLRTPNLRTLQLEGFNRLSMDFLGEVASSLQYLHIRHVSYEHRKEPFHEEGIDIYKFMHSHHMYESNVWTKLPQLKVFSSQVRDGESFVRKFYNRQMYDYFQNDTNDLLETSL